MNLTNFLKQVNAITLHYSAEQLTAFVHDIGRIIPEYMREEFLRRLKAAGGGAGEILIQSDENNFEEMYSCVRNYLKCIDSQEAYVSRIWNEEYDDWDSDSEDEFYYEDDSGIAEMFEDTCDFVHSCMDIGRYKEGFELGNQMLAMGILCVDDYYGDEEVSIKELVQHELLQYDLVQVILDTVYCAFHAVPPEERPETLYAVIANAGEDEITLEALMQHGDEELPDFEAFLPSWITYLGDKTGHAADRLIHEAVSLLNDVSLEQQYAEEFAAVHPKLFLNILENRKYESADEMIAVGTSAMVLIPEKYIVRSKTALKTAEYAIEAGGELMLLEKLYFAAYESDTSAMNYLRALLNGYEDGQKREELRAVFMKMTVQNGSSYSGYLRSEREENKPDGNMILLLRFLDGQFADVLEEGLNKSEALGWSGTFMKQGIALYLLYLHEGAWRGKGIIAMAGDVKRAMRFSAEEYRKGMSGLEEVSENDLFYQLFIKWKSMVQMDADVRERAVSKITGLLEKRVDGIMSANRRNYYGECAAFIAALGESLESMGEKGAKQRIMTAYQKKYSRRYAFREDLRNYGWIDPKK